MEFLVFLHHKGDHEAVTGEVLVEVARLRLDELGAEIRACLGSSTGVNDATRSVAFVFGCGAEKTDVRKGKGQIKERFEREVTRTLQGSEITKDGDEDNPAYLIKQEDGDEVLKRGSEIEAQD